MELIDEKPPKHTHASAPDFTQYERARYVSIARNHRLVETLLPAKMKQNGAFAIKHAETHACLDQIIYNRHAAMYGEDCRSSLVLARLVFTFEGAPIECMLELANRARLVFHCKKIVDLEKTPVGVPYTYAKESCCVDVCSDFRVFEANFKRACPYWLLACGKQPIWCYILLAMLVYDDELRARHECVGATVFECMRPFFGRNSVIGANDAPYPFLAQLHRGAHARRGDALAIVSCIK